MKKTFAVIFFVACLQLLSLKVGSSVVKYELLKNQIYAGEVIPPKTIKNPSSGAAYNKPAATSDTVTDIDGNVYHVVKIGKQRWLKENLKTKHFSDGSAILELEYDIDWPYSGKTGPVWCYYERNGQYNYPYGKLYNWYAVKDPRNVCPTGWHVPSDAEYQILSDTLGGDAVSGTHIKTIELWNEKDEKLADNTSGFTALPAGIRYASGSFNRAGADGADFWTSSRYRNWSALCRSLYYGGPNFDRHYMDRRSGLSVRCVGN